MPGFDFGPHASSCFSHHYPSFLHSFIPSFPPETRSRMSLLRHDVSRSDWPFPSSRTPLPAIHPLPIRNHAQSAAALPGGRMQLPTRLALQKNYATFTMTSHFTCTKGVTAHLYGGTYIQYGSFGLRWLFDDYHFLVLLLATSLTMALSYRVETSPTLPPYHSPRRHDSKNTTFHIPAFDSIFCRLLQGSSK